MSTATLILAAGVADPAGDHARGGRRRGVDPHRRLRAAADRDVAGAALGLLIPNRDLIELPLNGRNFTQLGTLMPGVIAPPAALGGQAGDATPGGFGNATGGFNVNGMRNQSNNFLLDGAPNNDSFNTGFVLRPPPDAIDEFRIFTHAFNAEYGRNAGAVVSVVTRAGSREWRGSGWWFDRDDALEARNRFAVTKPALDQHQFGGTAGGPIVENRAFVFGYYEGFRNRRGTTDTRVVPSAAQRAGDFSGGPAIRDPLTGQPFPGNVIPPARLDGIAAQLLDDYVPLPNQPGNRYTQSPDVLDRRHQFGVRVDHNVNESNKVLARVHAARTEQRNPLGPANFSPAGNVARARLLDALVSSTIGVRARPWSNEARVSINRIDAEPNVTSGLDPRDLGFAITPSNPIALGLPNIGVNGFFTLGDAQQPFASRVNDVLTIADDLTKIAGPPHASRAASRCAAIASRSRSSTGRTATSPSTGSTPATPPPTSCSACRSSTGRRPATRTWTATRGRRASTCRTTGGSRTGSASRPACATSAPRRSSSAATS